jgi:hypothetical protein
MASEVRHLLYGEAGYPEWGTKFSEIERDGMTVGLELGRLLMEQSVARQAENMPPEALEVPGDTVDPAGTQETDLETDAGKLTWDQPQGYLKKGRKAFFPPAESAGTGGR